MVDMRKLSAYLAESLRYRMRWCRRAFLCQYRNRFPRHEPRTPAELIRLHQEQKTAYQAYMQSVPASEEREASQQASLQVRMDLLPGNYRACLEIGCESGWFLEHLLQRKRIAEGFGMEIRRQELRPSRRSDLHFTNASAEALPFKSHRFDLIVALHVLEHIVAIGRLKTELRRVSAERTHILIALPLGYDDDPCHRWHFMTPNGWKRFLKMRLNLEFIQGGIYHTHITEFVGLFRLFQS